MGRRLTVIAVGWVIIGGIMMCGSGFMLITAWKASHGRGATGTFTLTQLDGCDRYQPPRQRCAWWGDFRSDDGRTIVRHTILDGLQPGAQVGDTVRARDVARQIFRIDDTQSWRESAAFLAVSSAVFLVGVLVLKPWTWRSRARTRPALSERRLRE
jgi:hypothetical protein